jgi:hypothetical protein
MSGLKRNSKGISLKVSEKGGGSVYGLGRFPVTCMLQTKNVARSFLNNASPGDYFHGSLLFRIAD